MASLKNSVSVKFDDKKVQRRLTAMIEASQEAIRPAAQLGAEELWLEARTRAPRSEKAHFFYGRNSKKTGVRYLFQPGTLQNSIYHVFSSDRSKEKGTGYARVTYHIAWNHIKCPYGFMVEFGTPQKPLGEPFMRPAYDAKKGDALQIAKAEFVFRMQKVIK